MPSPFLERVAFTVEDHLRRPDMCILSYNRVRLTIGNPHHAGLTAAEIRLAEKVNRLIDPDSPESQRRKEGVAMSVLAGDVWTAVCAHTSMIRPVIPRTPEGCEECLRTGSPWLHLRLCLTCGHVGCCDSSPGKHARRHAHGIGHPIVQSFEPGEDWRWCYYDETYV